MTEIKNKISNKYSYYKTLHLFESMYEVKSIDQIGPIINKLKDNNKQIYVLGNGSNTLFARKKIKTTIIINKIPEVISVINRNTVVASSSCKIKKILRYCFENDLDSFYYLSSVPATVGGAIAMNAGRGQQHNKTILDFVSSVTFINTEGEKKIINVQALKSGYRKTVFSESFIGFILEVEFKFTDKNISNNPIRERLQWSKKYQDYKYGNCGSVFKTFNSRILKALKGINIGSAWYSKKTTNWIVNKSKSSLGIRILLITTIVIHKILGKNIEKEIRYVK